jgi:hypothetical protein
VGSESIYLYLKFGFYKNKKHILPVLVLLIKPFKFDQSTNTINYKGFNLRAGDLIQTGTNLFLASISIKFGLETVSALHRLYVN